MASSSSSNNSSGTSQAARRRQRQKNQAAAAATATHGTSVAANTNVPGLPPTAATNVTTPTSAGISYMDDTKQPEWTYVWPSLPATWYAATTEAFFFFDTIYDGITPIDVASNFPYEVYFNGRYQGEGGFRCVRGIAYTDTWTDASLVKGTSVTIRVHYLNTDKMKVFYRCLFDDPFVAFKSASITRWACRVDASTVFGGKQSTQLPHQNLCTNSLQWQHVKPLNGSSGLLPIEVVDRDAWTLEPMPVFRPARVRMPLVLSDIATAPPADATVNTNSPTMGATDARSKARQALAARQAMNNATDVTITPRTGNSPTMVPVKKGRSAAAVIDDDDEDDDDNDDEDDEATVLPPPAVPIIPIIPVADPATRGGAAGRGARGVGTAPVEDSKAVAASPAVPAAASTAITHITPPPPVNPGQGIHAYQSEHLRSTSRSGGAASLQLLPSMDVTDLVVGRRPVVSRLDAFDLGNIALHRLEVVWHDGEHKSSTASAAGSGTAERLRFIASYSEVNQFSNAWASANRKKVHLSDGVDLVLPARAGAPNGVAIAAPFGQRGGRYLYIVREAAMTRVQAPIQVVAWQHHYPLRWKTDWIAVAQAAGAKATIREHLLASCQRNMIACVDGAIVDTCHRERALWTGDLWVSLTALRALCSGDGHNEVALNCIRQIASTYDSKTGMVSGVAASRTPDYHLAMATYHMYWCMTVLDLNDHVKRLAGVATNAPPAFFAKKEGKDATPSAAGSSTPSVPAPSLHVGDVDPEFKAMMATTATAMKVHLPQLMKMVVDSIGVWKAKYLRGGILQSQPGWNFVDWDMSGKDEDTIGRQGAGMINGPNCVIHALWYHVCQRLAIPSDIDTKEFMRTFWTGNGFSMLRYNSQAAMLPDAAPAPSSSSARGGGNAAQGGANNRQNGRAPSNSSGVSTSTNPHATSSVLAFAPELCPAGTAVLDTCYTTLQHMATSNELALRMTPYYAYIPALALYRRNPQLSMDFIEAYYWQKVRGVGTGTLQEKVADTASKAHGWSVGIAHLLTL